METATWVDRDAYPFASSFIDLDAGRLHYVDQGQGQPLLMVHGTPTWSFLYRHLIADLSTDYRCIAVDNLGFGLSERPPNGGYRPADHARNLAQFVDRLVLRDIVLLIHDFGGPIGLSYALERPDNVAGLVLFNTWMWSVKEDPHFARAGRLLSGRLGRLLYLRLNFALRFMLRTAWGDKSRLTPQVYRQYTGPFPTPADRLPLWTLARELIGSSDWYDQLWQRRARIADKPALVLWGLKDPAFRTVELERWRGLLRRAEFVTYPAVGHFVPDEQPDLGPVVRRFLVGLGVEGLVGRPSPPAPLPTSGEG